MTLNKTCVLSYSLLFLRKNRSCRLTFCPHCGVERRVKLLISCKSQTRQVRGCHCLMEIVHTLTVTPLPASAWTNMWCKKRTRPDRWRWTIYVFSVIICYFYRKSKAFTWLVITQPGGESLLQTVNSCKLHIGQVRKHHCFMAMNQKLTIAPPLASAWTNRRCKKQTKLTDDTEQYVYSQLPPAISEKWFRLKS